MSVNHYYGWTKNQRDFLWAFLRDTEDWNPYGEMDFQTLICAALQLFKMTAWDFERKFHVPTYALEKWLEGHPPDRYEQKRMVRKLHEEAQDRLYDYDYDEEAGPKKSMFRHWKHMMELLDIGEDLEKAYRSHLKEHGIYRNEADLEAEVAYLEDLEDRERYCREVVGWE